MAKQKNSLNILWKTCLKLVNTSLSHTKLFSYKFFSTNLEKMFYTSEREKANFMKFQEILTIVENPTDDRYHLADKDYLLSIFKAGAIKGSQYSVGKRHAKGSKDFQEKEDDPYEFCILRKGTIRNISDLSDNAGYSKILLDRENIQNIRNIKKPYPIAEIPLETEKQLINQINYLKKLGRTSLAENIQKYLKYKPLLAPEKFNNLLPSYLNKELNLTINQIKESYKMYYSYLQNREQEERYDLTKASIPVSSKYIKIILDKRELSSEVIKYIKMYYKKDPNLFQKNDALKIALS